MNGHVDEHLRALIPIRVAAKDGEPHELLAWIDTAFNGSLVIPQVKVDELRLPRESSAEAILSKWATKSNWKLTVAPSSGSARTYDTQIVTNDGEYGLIGTMLLAGHKLEIDYVAGTVTLR